MKQYKSINGVTIDEKFSKTDISERIPYNSTLEGQYLKQPDFGSIQLDLRPFSDFYDLNHFYDLQRKINNLDLLIETGCPSKKVVLELTSQYNTFKYLDTALDISSFQIKKKFNDFKLADQPDADHVGRSYFVSICKRKTIYYSELRNHFAFGKGSWSPIESKETLAQKMNIIVTRQLAGLSWATLGGDDKRGICGQGKYPLFRNSSRLIEQLNCNCSSETKQGRHHSLFI